MDDGGIFSHFFCNLLFFQKASAPKEVIFHLETHEADDGHEEGPFPPMLNCKGKVAQKNAEQQPDENYKKIFQFHRKAPSFSGFIIRLLDHESNRCLIKKYDYGIIISEG